MKRKLAMIFNIGIGVMSYGSWLFMAVLRIESGQLAANGFGSLKYYTVLSNLLNGLICLLYAYWLVRGKQISVWQRTAKLVGTTVVMLTFLTVMLMLGPLYGYGTMFLGANLWMHLLLPLASLFTFLVLEREDACVPVKKICWAMSATLLYEIGYVLNMVIHGVGTYPNSNDFYGFLLWGYGMAAVIAVVMLAVTGAAAAVLRYFGCRQR